MNNELKKSMERNPNYMSYILKTECSKFKELAAMLNELDDIAWANHRVCCSLEDDESMTDADIDTAYAIHDADETTNDSIDSLGDFDIAISNLYDAILELGNWIDYNPYKGLSSKAVEALDEVVGVIKHWF